MAFFDFPHPGIGGDGEVGFELAKITPLVFEGGLGTGHDFPVFLQQLAKSLAAGQPFNPVELVAVFA